MDFLAGEALGALIFFAAFWLAIKFLERHRYTQAKQEVVQQALPYSITNDQIEAVRERELLGPKDEYLDPPPGIGRV